MIPKRGPGEEQEKRFAKVAKKIPQAITACVSTSKNVSLMSLVKNCCVQTESADVRSDAGTQTNNVRFLSVVTDHGVNVSPKVDDIMNGGHSALSLLDIKHPTKSTASSNSLDFIGDDRNPFDEDYGSERDSTSEISDIDRSIATSSTSTMGNYSTLSLSNNNINVPTGLEKKASASKFSMSNMLRNFKMKSQISCGTSSGSSLPARNFSKTSPPTPSASSKSASKKTAAVLSFQPPTPHMRKKVEESRVRLNDMNKPRDSYNPPSKKEAELLVSLPRAEELIKSANSTSKKISTSLLVTNQNAAAVALSNPKCTGAAIPKSKPSKKRGRPKKNESAASGAEDTGSASELNFADESEINGDVEMSLADSSGKKTSVNSNGKAKGYINRWSDQPDFVVDPKEHLQNLLNARYNNRPMRKRRRRMETVDHWDFAGYQNCILKTLRFFFVHFESILRSWFSQRCFCKLNWKTQSR